MRNPPHTYDAIYDALGKDYGREAARIHALIQEHKRSAGNALLDVACGTGGHIGHLRQHYTVEGLDLEGAMLGIARRKHPDNGLAVLEFHFLVGTPEGVQRFTEQHELALFTHTDFTDAFQSSGLETTHDPDGLIGRSLYIGTRPPGTGLEAVPFR
jgi:ubiquinone/menaquinone biosynthesis C-methylase UbiE